MEAEILVRLFAYPDQLKYPAAAQSRIKSCCLVIEARRGQATDRFSLAWISAPS
jgi:hypothetical protein